MSGAKIHHPRDTYTIAYTNMFHSDNNNNENHHHDVHQYLNNHHVQPMKCGMPTKAEFIWWLYASGSSTVAIDNKIEQAMDLVKSHLMFAVREEVDVLKEKITELMDRINQLEYENSILRANASQETLAKLSQPPPNPQPPNPSS